MPKLTVTATLTKTPVSRDAELHGLRELVDMATHAARGAGGHKLSGKVDGAFGVGSATWTYTPGE